jgi:hypothetical protein
MSNREPVYCDVRDPQAREQHKPTSCPDKILTAFCQLGALRMKARRCLIFFFDVNHAFGCEKEEIYTFIVELLLTLSAVCLTSSLTLQKKFPAEFVQTTLESAIASPFPPLTSNPSH